MPRYFALCCLLLGCCILLVIPCVSGQNLQQDTTQANLYRKVGDQFLEQADYAAGNDMLRKALDLYQKHGRWLSFFETQNQIAKGLWRNGEADEALALSRQIIQDSKTRLGDSTLVVVEAWNNMGAVYGMKGYYDIAINHFENSLRLRRRLLGDTHPSLAKAYHNIGVVCKNEGRYEDALQYLQHALTLKIQQYGWDDKNLISTYQVLGMVHIERSAYAQARDYFQKALQLLNAEYGKDHPQTADGYLRLGIVFRYEKDFKKAFAHYDTTVQIARHVYGDDVRHPYWAPIYNNIGEAHLEEGALDSARFYFQKALQGSLANHGSQHPQTLHILSNIGRCYDAGKQYRQAIHYFQTVRQGFTSIHGTKASALADICNALSETYYDMHRLDSALWFAHAAILANVLHYEDTTLHHTPPIREAQYTTALGFIESLDLKGKIYNRLYKQANDVTALRRAHETYQNALLLIQKAQQDLSLQSDKERWLSLQQQAYRGAIRSGEQLFRQTGDKMYAEQAFEASERNKSVLLTQAVHESGARRFGGVPDSILSQEHQLKISIAGMEKKLWDAKNNKDTEKIQYIENQLFRARQQQEQLHQRLKEQYQKYYALHYESTIASPPQLQQHVLAPYQALIEYFVTDSTVYIFSLHGGHFDVIRSDFPQLATAVSDLRRCLAHAPNSPSNGEEQRSDLIRSAHLLYEKLIAPLHLPDSIRRLVIVPDGLLNYVPFDALLATVPAFDLPFPQWDYLLLHYAISYSYTGSLLYDFYQHPTQPYNQKMLALAPMYQPTQTPNPRRSLQVQHLRTQLNDLPGAQREVQRLGELFEGTFLFKEQANEREWMANVGHYGILHLAMHGVLNRQQPTESALVLSETADTANDNVLFAYEINNLPLQTELVVLSACETGYGKFQQGEGSMSLARSFMYAGAHSLLMSMWEVNDQSTQQIMYFFYQYLKEGLPKDVALQRAKVQYLRQAKEMAAHPFLWAAFVPLGETKPIHIQERTPYMLFLGLAIVVLTLMRGLNQYLHRQQLAEKR